MKRFDRDGNLKFEADHGLVYDGILQHVRLVIYIYDGTVRGYVLMPKLRRCPAGLRKAIGSYYAPT